MHAAPMVASGKPFGSVDLPPERVTAGVKGMDVLSTSDRVCRMVSNAYPFPF